MKRYSILHAPVLSFYSEALYRDVCFRWKGTGLAYLFLLLALCWIGPAVKFQLGLAEYLDNEAPKVVSQIPTLTFRDGNASTEVPQPHRVTDPTTGETLLVIDTTGTLTTLDEAQAPGLVTRTQAFLRKNSIETRAFSFQDIDQFTLDQKTITGWLNTAKRNLVPALYPLLVVGSFALRLNQILLYALIGMWFAARCHCTRTFRQLLRLSTVAATPCIVVKTAFAIAEVRLPYAGFWFFLATVGFLLFGIKVSSQDEASAP